MYLLDTNIVSDMIRNPRGVINARVRLVGEDQVATSIIVAGALRYGAERRRWTALTTQMELVLAQIPILPLEHDADRRYGVLRADLERRGQRSAPTTC